MTNMRAIIGGSGAPLLVTVPVPEAGPGQVRIKVAAAGVNPFDLAVAAGALVTYGLARKRDSYGIGFDVAGTVDQVGPGTTFGVGEEVVGLCARLELPYKAQAEYVVLDASAVARAPRNVSAAQAATLPLNGLTAWQALDRAGVGPGGTLLVTGAAGAVGGYLVELAAEHGIRVVATAGAADEEVVRDFGAEWFVPRQEELAEAVRALVPGGVDAVVDAAVLGLPALDAVRDGGAFVALSAGVAPVALRGTDVATVFFRSDAYQLAELVRLVEAGRLTLRVAETYGLEQVAEAHARQAEGGLRGRLVLLP
ncbi:NADP-dependent oxidoreductase [Nonomuraea sp. WAC 01424]|uniref:NADP-dependent oxidoreductase n=1 Tax=Nonomuraea sp. WAC 01424 TaxID=2203200 RepID=UPI0021AD5F77|nr:NADP-dependent oxidoreductase [Nonomuraea sp. WAC 01424]